MGQTSLFRRIWSQVLVSYAIVGNKFWFACAMVGNEFWSHVLLWATNFGSMCYGGQHCSLQLPAVPGRKINWQGNFVYRSTMELWIMNLRWPYNYSLLILMMMNMQIISFKFSQQLFNINSCSKYDVFSMMLLSVVQFKLWICCCSIFAWPTFKVKWGNRPFEQVLPGDKQ